MSDDKRGKSADIGKVGRRSGERRTDGAQFDGEDRREGERRSGQDRRKTDRRSGRERRDPAND